MILKIIIFLTKEYKKNINNYKIKKIEFIFIYFYKINLKDI